MVPLLPHFLVYLGGVLSALPASRDFLFPFFLSLGMVLSALAVYRRTGRRSLRQWVLLLVFFPLGTLAPGWADTFRPANHALFHVQEDRRGTVEGVLYENPRVLEDRVQYVVELTRLRYQEETLEVCGRARITLYQPENSFRAGDILRFNKVRLKPPRNFKNPGRFDYQRYLENQNIDLIGNVSKAGSIERVGSVPPPFWVSLREHLRARGLETIDARFPGPGGALLKALLLGEKQSLPSELREAYRATGVGHLMAVSGLHIGFVAGASYFLLWPLVFYGLHRFSPQWAKAGYSGKFTAFLCVFPVLFYMVLVGDKVSALRAGIMVLIFLAAVLLGRQKSVFNALLAAGFLILLRDPKAVLDPGFQMSFLAVATILFAFHFIVKTGDDPVDRMGEPRWIQKYLAGWDPGTGTTGEGRGRLLWEIKRILAGTAFVSCAAILGTLPIMLIHFHHISLIGFFLNLLLVPLASLLIPLALLMMCLGILWQGLAGMLFWPVFLLLKVFLELPPIFTALPFASVHIPTPPRIWFVLYYFILFGTLYACRNKPPLLTHERKTPLLKRKPLECAVGLAAVFVIVGLIWPRFPELRRDTLSISILDVGQGESIFIEFPNGQTMVLDGGGFFKNRLDVGKLVVAPFIWNRGIGTIDYLAVTHSDHDHISGLESLLDYFKVRYFLDGFQGMPDHRIEHLRKKALRKRAKRIPLRMGEPLQIGEVQLLPLHPEPGFIGTARQNKRTRVGNNLSLVLRLDYRKFSMLLTGDISREAEEYLVAHSAPLDAVFLKAPHHGSRFSSTPAFIEAVGPRAVFFSSGHLNPMRHPHPDVIGRYRTAGAEVWRTDRQGALQITTDGYHHHIQSHEDL